MNIHKILIFIGAILMTLNMAGCISHTRNVANGKIVFQLAKNGNYYLYIMNPDGSDQQNLTNNSFNASIEASFHADFTPVASPDGKRIAFVSKRDGNNEIYVIDIDSGLQKNLTLNKADDASPAWSPDSKYIAFVSDRDAILLDANRDLWTNNIYIMDVDSSSVRRLTKDNKINEYGGLSWSPDGKQLAFNMFSLNPYGLFYSAGINIMNLINASITRLPYDASLIDGEPKWSPNGKHILYSVSGSKFSDIYIMNTDGTNQVALSKGTSVYDTDPSWSPNGNYIVFSSNRDGKYHIYVMNTDGSNQKQLTNGDDEEAFPTWLSEQ